MNLTKNSSFFCIKALFLLLAASCTAVFFSCSSFSYKTYDVKANEKIDDPEPNYDLTLDRDFQDYTNFMFIGNRNENFGTYFNTYFNAKENYDDAYDIYITRVLANYGNRIDSVYINQVLSQEAADLFNKAIEKASKVIQFHKSSALMDRAVLLIGQSYFYLGDYIKAERKFGEFASKLSKSPYNDENLLYYSKTQLRLGNYTAALQRLDELIKNTQSNTVKADAYQTIAEYFLTKKDYASAVLNYKKAIEFSRDSEFKAQMQYLLATVAGQSDYKLAAKEFDDVLDFNASYDLEFLARLNRLKFLIKSNDFNSAEPLIDNLRVKYKDNPDFVAQVEFLQGYYHEQKKDFKKANKAYDIVMQQYPKTSSSSSASYQVAKYYETVMNDYLNAYRYYKYSTEENSTAKNYQDGVIRVKLFKHYFDLRSAIAGQTINTDYDSLFNYHTRGTTKKNDESIPDPNNPDKGRGTELPKPGGYSSLPADSVLMNSDSTKLRAEVISKAKFELAELFDYDLKRLDSSEYYYKSAFEESGDYDFRSKVLYALASLYRQEGSDAKSDETLHRIVNEFQLSPIANEVKRELKMPVSDDVAGDAADSLYLYSESKFNVSDYASALQGYKQIAENYPSTVHGIKSNYSAGWIYENVLFKPDSAYVYYSRIIASSPKSDYASAVTGKVKEYEESLKTHNPDTTGIKDTSSVKDTTGTGLKKMTNDSSKTGTNSNSMDKGPIKDLNNPDLKKEKETPIKIDGEEKKK